MRDCDTMIELAALLPDGELTEDEVKALKTHTQQCESCRRRMEAYGALSGALRDMKTAAPDTLVPGVLYKVSLPPERKGLVRFFPRATTLVAACLILVLAVVLQQGNLFGPGLGHDTGASDENAPHEVLFAAPKEADMMDAGEDSIEDAVPRGVPVTIDAPAESGEIPLPSMVPDSAGGEEPPFLLQGSGDGQAEKYADLLPLEAPFRSAFITTETMPEAFVARAETRTDGAVYYFWLDTEDEFNAYLRDHVGEICEGEETAEKWVLVFVSSL